MSDPVLSDGVGILIAPETTAGLQPAANWLQLQINPGGITDFGRMNVEVDRHILSPNLTPERGEVVGYDVSPKLAGDLTIDLLMAIREPTFRSLTKHSGGTGLSEFRPTAVTNGAPSSWSVPALGALPAGLLVRGDGFTNAANNGLHVLAAGSTGLLIKTADALVTEVPPANALLRVAGVQGAAADITLDGNGDLTSTILDFTTLGLNVGQDLIVGDPTSGAAFAFATAAYQGKATIKGPITAHKIPLRLRSWTVGAQDLGAGKTIRILFQLYIMNVPLTDANYLKRPTVGIELSEPGAGTAGAVDYTYGLGLGVDAVDLDIPTEGKVGVTIGFVGMSMTEPAAARAVNAATALAPLLSGIFSTAAKLQNLRLLKQSDESSLSVDVNSVKVALKNNITPMKKIGTSGASDLFYGEYTPSLSTNAYLKSNDMIRAADANTDATQDMLLTNADGGVSFLFHMVKLRKPKKSYAAHTSVMVANDIPANRDPSSGILYSMSQFAYVP